MHRILVFCLVGLFFVFSHGVYGHDIDDGSHHATAGQVVRYNKAIPDGEHLHVEHSEVRDGSIQTTFTLHPNQDGDKDQTPIQQPPPTDVHDHTREEYKEGVAITHIDHPNMNGVEIPDDHVHKIGESPTNKDGTPIKDDSDPDPDPIVQHFHFLNHNHKDNNYMHLNGSEIDVGSDHAHRIDHKHRIASGTHPHPVEYLDGLISQERHHADHSLGTEHTHTHTHQHSGLREHTHNPSHTGHHETQFHYNGYGVDENENDVHAKAHPNYVQPSSAFQSNQRNQFDFSVGNDDYQHPISIHNVVYKDKEKPKYIRVNFRNSGENSIRLNENWRFVMIDPVDGTEIIKLYRTFASKNIHYGAVLSSTRNPNKEFETTIAILGNRTAIENFDYSSEKRVKFGLEFRFNSSKVGGYHDHYIFTLQNRANKLSDWVEIARFPMPEEDIAASPSKIKTMTTTWGSLKKN